MQYENSMDQCNENKNKNLKTDDDENPYNNDTC